MVAIERNARALVDRRLALSMSDRGLDRRERMSDRGLDRRERVSDRRLQRRERIDVSVLVDDALQEAAPGAAGRRPTVRTDLGGV